MKEKITKLQGSAPCPDLFLKGNNLYDCPQMSMVNTNFPIDIEPGAHEHESYEFVLPITTMPFAKWGKENFCFVPGKVYPISAGQPHGVNKRMVGIKLLSIMVDKTLMNSLTYSISGKTDLYLGDNPFNLDIELRLLIQTFIKESKSMQVGFDFMLQSLSTQILINLIRNCNTTLLTAAKDRHIIVPNNRINRVIEMIREYYNRDFSLDDLAREANLSPYHFIRAFKNQTGHTPYDYLINVRIDKAKELMHLNMSITDICLLCGFNNHSHFTTVFKKRVGVTPSQYRQVLIGK